MQVTELEVFNFRCHSQLKIDFLSNKTLIRGLNGSGKTSLIEAIYLLLRGKSFRGFDNDMVRNDTSWYKAILKITDGERIEKREVRFIGEQNKNRQFQINQRKTPRLANNKKIPIVLFQPDDLNLINGSPSRRRQFFDEIVMQIKPEHSTLLSRYEKILRQRNNLIKNNPEVEISDLFSWDVMLANYGAKIIKNRLEILREINNLISQVYQEITSVEDKIKINYSEEYNDESKIEQKIFEKLTKQSNLFLGTMVGPQRDDFIINFNNTKASQHTSRGENRSIILSLKIIEADLIYKNYQQKPLILLDDVFSELDENRRKFLMSRASQNQIIITSTESLDLSEVQKIEI